jgi:lysophospholipase L1-like esterase
MGGFFLLALGAGGCDRGVPGGGAETKVGGIRVLCLGDSYTIGEWVEVGERWPVQMAGMLREQGVEVVEPEIVARTGWTTTELMSAMDARGVSGEWEVVTVLAGVNDEFRGGDAETFRGNFRVLLGRAVGLARGRSAWRVVVLAIPDWGLTPYGRGSGRERVGEEIAAFNRVCREEAERAGAVWVDTTAESNEVRSDESLVAEDGLHPSGALYRRWAQKASMAVRGIVTGATTRHGPEQP